MKELDEKINLSDDEIKSIRAAKMAEECDRVSEEIFKSLIGHTRSVLFEQKTGEYSHGYSEDYLSVYVKEDITPGEIKNVKILGTLKDGVLAEILK